MRAACSASSHRALTGRKARPPKLLETQQQTPPTHLKPAANQQPAAPFPARTEKGAGFTQSPLPPDAEPAPFAAAKRRLDCRAKAYGAHSSPQANAPTRRAVRCLEEALVHERRR